VRMICCSGLSHCGGHSDEPVAIQTVTVEDSGYNLPDGAGLRSMRAAHFKTSSRFNTPRLLGRTAFLQEADPGSDCEFKEPCAEPEPAALLAANCGCSLAEPLRWRRWSKCKEKGIEVEEVRPRRSPVLETLPTEVPAQVQLRPSPKRHEHKSEELRDAATMTNSREIKGLADSVGKEGRTEHPSPRKGLAERCANVESEIPHGTSGGIEENPMILYPWEVEMSMLGVLDGAAAATKLVESPLATFDTGLKAQRGSFSFFVELQRQGACPIGMETRALLSKVTGALRVDSVRSTGLIAEWNQNSKLNGGHQVRAGDYILEVNGASGNSTILYDAFSQPGPLTLLVMRLQSGRRSRRSSKRASSSTRASSDEELTEGSLSFRGNASC